MKKRQAEERKQETGESHVQSFLDMIDHQI